MLNRPNTVLRILTLLAALILAACTNRLPPTPTALPEPTPTPEASPTPYPYQPGSWWRLTPYHWSHDGMHYESEHFIVFSDGARMEEKARFAAEAEESLAFILETLHVEEDELRFPPGLGKIEIFGSTKHTQELGGGYAYYGGFLFTYDQADYRMLAGQYPESFIFRPLFTHELTHEVAFLLSGYASHDNMLVATWFDEGLAVFVSRDDPYRINSLAMLTNLRQTLEEVPGKGNPVLINRWEQIPPQYLTDVMMNKLYGMFELAVRYLVDTYGVETCKMVYLDTRAGMTFEEAFADQYGMRLADFQETFFTRMEGYLH
jgi:hypothetical protein